MQPEAKCWCRERTVSVLRKSLVWSPTGQYSSVLARVLDYLFCKMTNGIYLKTCCIM